MVSLITIILKALKQLINFSQIGINFTDKSISSENP